MLLVPDPAHRLSNARFGPCARVSLAKNISSITPAANNFDIVTFHYIIEHNKPQFLGSQIYNHAFFSYECSLLQEKDRKTARSTIENPRM
jgi:hypothetical protein